MADFYGRKKDEKLWSDFNAQPVETAVEQQPAQSAQPVQQVIQQQYEMQCKNSEPMQMAPIVQPLVIVPYSTQMQPLYQYSPDYAQLPGYGYDEEDDFEEEAVGKKAKKAKKEKKVKAEKAPSARSGKARIMGLFTLIFSIVVLAAVIIDMFMKGFVLANITDGSFLQGNNVSVILALPLLLIDGINSLFNTAIALPEAIGEILSMGDPFYQSVGSSGFVATGIISVAVLCMVITAIVVLIRSLVRLIGGKGKKSDWVAGLAMLIFSIVALAVEFLACMMGGQMNLMDALNTAVLTNYGTIAFVALSLLITVFSAIGGAKKK